MIKQETEKKITLRSRILSRFVIDVNPDRVTIAGFASAILSGFFFWKGNFVVAAFFLGMNGFLDVLDGEIAKKRRATKRGDFLDHTFDRLSDTIIFLGLAYNPTIPTNAAFIGLIALLLVSYMGRQAQALTKARMYGGILGRAGRHVILFVGALVTYVTPQALTYAIYIIIVLSVITFLQRFKSTYEILSKEL